MGNFAAPNRKNANGASQRRICVLKFMLGATDDWRFHRSSRGRRSNMRMNANMIESRCLIGAIDSRDSFQNGLAARKTIS
jgi:hypothetical protein